jgi:hypothetical protein
MHIVMRFVFPKCSTLHKTIYKHLHCHAHYHTISVSDMLVTGSNKFLPTFTLSYTLSCASVIPICSTMIHSTVYRHSSCFAPCYAISASDMLDTGPYPVYLQSHCHAHCHVLCISAMLDTDPLHCLRTFVLSCV